MSLSTSYRYEAMTEKKSLKNALKRQHERIKVTYYIIDDGPGPGPWPVVLDCSGEHGFL